MHASLTAVERAVEEAVRQTIQSLDAKFVALQAENSRLSAALAEAKAQARRDAFEVAAQEAKHQARAMRMAGIPSEINDIRANAVMTVALALEVLATAPAETEKPETGEAKLERVRHLKRGTEYEVLGEAEVQVATGSHKIWLKGADTSSEYAAIPARLAHDGEEITVYRDPKSGKLWCRFTDEFRDGRFETITPPQPTATNTLEDGHA